ncbi:MAG: efflux transporter periplasmic adaptor subunit, partial [Pseudomonadota bacterium]
MRFLRRSLSGLFLFSVTLGLGFLAVMMVVTAIGDSAGDERRGGGGRERVFAVNVVPFEPQTQTPILSVFGEVQSARVLDLRPSAGGTVMSIHPNFLNGGRVVADDLLIEIDPANAQTALDFSQADVAEAQAENRDASRALGLAQEELIAAQEQVALRQKALQRQQDLVARGVGTAAALEAAELADASSRQAVIARRQALAQAEARLDLAQARVDRSAIALAEADRNLKATRLYAPFDGILTGVDLVLGGNVTANERIGQMVDPSALDVA